MDTSPEQIVEALSAPLLAYRSALDEGVSFADTIMHGLPWCPWTWAHNARYLTAVRLEDAAVDKDWTVTRLHNSGLEIHANGYTIRPLKTADSGPPAPGRNASRRHYFSQFRQNELFSVKEPQANLLLDWTVLADRSTSLALSKPIGNWKYKGDPLVEWRLPVIFADDGQPTFAPVEISDDITVLPSIDQAEFQDGSS